MAIRITIDEKLRPGSTTLLVEGQLRLEEAGLLKDICARILAETNRQMVINLAGITFLDSDSAFLLIELKKQGAILEDLDFFIRRVIEWAESQEVV